jgi:glutamate carboxypeptidase
MSADPTTKEWRDAKAAEIAERALGETVDLVAISSPSGDAEAAERAVAAATGMLPPAATVERIECSSPGHAPDLLARVTGTGRRRVLLLGHLDTVVAHERHRPAVIEGELLRGSGTIDMKGGDALALGVLRALAECPSSFAEIALLLVNDEEFRTSPFIHGPRFAGFDACLCFEGGERLADGTEAVVVKRKAASAFQVEAAGVAAHSGANPDAGRSALLALARVAADLAGRHDPGGPEALSVVPTMVRAGEAINAVPATGELLVDIRADSERAFEPVVGSIPAELDGVALRTEVLRLWPGLDARQIAAAPLERAAAMLGRAIAPTSRGGASDASNIAPDVPLAIDGLGPLGAFAHNPDEYLMLDSLRPRAELALAVAAAILAG